MGQCRATRQRVETGTPVEYCLRERGHTGLCKFDSDKANVTKNEVTIKAQFSPGTSLKQIADWIAKAPGIVKITPPPR